MGRSPEAGSLSGRVVSRVGMSRGREDFWEKPHDRITKNMNKLEEGRKPILGFGRGRYGF